MTPVCRRILAFVLFLALGACAAETARETSRVARAGGPPRIALLPPDVSLTRLTAGGSRQPVAAWTLAAERNLTLGLMEAVRARGARAEPAPYDLWADSGLQSVRLLYGRVAAAILAHRFGRRGDRLPAKAGSLGWSLGEAVGPLRDRLGGADYGLFVTLDDSYASGGRRALAVAEILLFLVPATWPSGAQTGLATLVDLRSGAVVWASHIDRASGELRTPDAARETAAAFLRDLPL